MCTKTIFGTQFAATNIFRGPIFRPKMLGAQFAKNQIEPRTWDPIVVFFGAELGLGSIWYLVFGIFLVDF